MLNFNQLFRTLLKTQYVVGLTAQIYPLWDYLAQIYLLEGIISMVHMNFYQ